MSEKVPGNGGSKHLFYGVLNPVDRSNEVLFGLIMVMTFTNSLSTTDAGRADVRSCWLELSAAIWRGVSLTPSCTS